MNDEAIKKLLSIYSELETKLLDEIVKHFKINEEFINSDFWRVTKLEELGVLNNNIIKYIAEVTDRTPEEIEEALRTVGYEALNINRLNEAYKGGLLKVNPSILIENKVIENLINYSYNELTNRFLEISNKIEQRTREAYLNIVEKAYIQISEGITYQEAIRNSLLELGDKGITTLTYRTIDDDGNVVGIRNYDVEGAVRRELVTATHNLTNSINQAVADELEVEYLYLSEHIRCRPQHFPWQGTIIKREDLVKVTRLGEVDGMGGPNCKHYPTPYFGTARGKELKKISLEEATEQYDLSQKQRYLERGIRKWKRKERLFKNVEDKEYYEKCKEKVKEWQLRNKKFTEKNNLRRDFSRENVEKVTRINRNDIIINEDEQNALNKYISSDFYSINEKLRNNMQLNNEELILADNLDKALNKMPNYDGLVTRSLELDQDKLQQFINIHQVDNIVQYKAYTSTTKGEKYNEYSNVELYIYSKTGKNIEKYNPEEQEILFKRNSLFKVKQIEKINKVYHILLEDINGE